MNRRNFIKTSVLAGMISPSLFASTGSINMKIDAWKHCVRIFDSEDFLKMSGIDGAPFCATVIDRAGKFCHDPLFSDSGGTIPIIVKRHRIQCLPAIILPKESPPGDDTLVVDYVKKIRNSISIQNKLIKELKLTFRYISFLEYMAVQCLCGSEKCSGHYKKWVPYVQGITYKRYHNFLESGNYTMPIV